MTERCIFRREQVGEKPVRLIGRALFYDGRTGWLAMKDGLITDVETGPCPKSLVDEARAQDAYLDADGRLLLPGVVDEHVHFRDPGLWAKGDMATESRAAVAGGVTSFLDMPNTIPPTVTLEAVRAKLDRAAQTSLANYGVWVGATTANAESLGSILDSGLVAGVKLFMGSTTGDMAVDAPAAVRRVMEVAAAHDATVAVHAEDNAVIAANAAVPVTEHPAIRSHQACVRSTAAAIAACRQTGCRLRVMHVTTAQELEMIRRAREEGLPVTAETCVQYLWWAAEEDMERLGARIKCNPAIKTAQDRQALRQGVADGTIDIVATDHAPHLLSDKAGGALTAASGMPSIQFGLPAMLALARQGHFSVRRVQEAMCQNPARLNRIKGRGRLAPGFAADLTLVTQDWNLRRTVEASDVQSRCGWSPFEGVEFRDRVTFTWVNGEMTYRGGDFLIPSASQRLEYYK